MPNIICEELVYKDGKVDIVEQEASKFWNEKIQRLEAENKKLKELYEAQQKETDIEHQRYLETAEKYSDKLWQVCQELDIENHDTSENIIEEIKKLKAENKKYENKWEMFNVNRDLEVIRLTAEYGSEEIHNCMKENKALEYRVKKYKAMNWKRMDDLVKALSPWKKNHRDHKRILEAIGELKEENKKLKSDKKDNSRYWECIMDFCHNPENPNKDYIVQWCELNNVSDEDKQELLIDFGFDEEECQSKSAR
mgnify:CR=1 FL=1|tara:strand:+ start:905 stop:1660 length:756 start_codon:yes stop_codon:yes gene_type:complete